MLITIFNRLSAEFMQKLNFGKKSTGLEVCGPNGLKTCGRLTFVVSGARAVLG